MGWINLSTLAMLTLAAPDSDNDGISDAWEYEYTNTLLVLDDDGDGVPYIGADLVNTDPFDAGDLLVITQTPRHLKPPTGKCGRSERRGSIHFSTSPR